MLYPRTKLPIIHIAFLVISNFLLVQGQDTLKLGTFFSDPKMQSEYFQYFVDPTKSIDSKGVYKETFLSKQELLKEHSALTNTENFWVKFVVRNDLEVDTFIYFTFSNNKKATLNQYENGALVSSRNFGLHLNKKVWPNEYSPGYIPINIKSKSEQTILAVRNQDAIYTDADYMRLAASPQLLSATKFQNVRNNTERSNKRLYGFWYVFLGIFIFLFLFTLVQFIQHKELSFLYYSIYILAVFVFYSDYTERFDGFDFFFTYFQLPCCFFDLTSYLIMLIYPVFMAQFLELKKHTPRFYKFFILQYPIIIVAFLVHLTMYITNYKPALQTQLYYNFRAFMSLPYLINIFIIGLLYRNRMGLFIVLGSLSLALGSIIAIVLQKYDMHSIVYTQCGVLVECFFFSSILGYRQKIIQDEKAETQDQLITQLQKNNELSNQLNSNLKAEVDKKSKEILRQTEATVKAEYNEKLSKLESQMLRSRMNPHFIFNCLNSIDNFVLKNQADKASDYLTKFSKLMRNTLDYSKRNQISLQEEIENLKLYVHMEQLRFSKKFDFEIIEHTKKIPDEYKIPPLTLQPFIENAIWHGILHLDQHGFIKITIVDQEEHFQISIKDNGVGRAKAREIKSLSAVKNKSYGMKITEERLKINDIDSVIDQGIQVIDNVNEYGLASGTEVILKIPYSSETYK